MSASSRARRAAVRLAAGAAAVLAVCEAANLASQASGVMAGAAVIGAVFAACWIIFRVRPMLRLTRPARKCEPVPAVLAGDRQPTQLAA